MKRILALLCVLCGVAMMSIAQQPRQITVDQMLGSRICLYHAYDWHEDAVTGNITISEADPFYCGGWNTTIEVSSPIGYLTFVGGITNYQVSQPFKVNYSTNTITLVADGEPFATLTDSSESVAGGTTTRIDNVHYYYVVNEDWMLNGSDLADVTGTILADGSIHIEGGFAYYIETVKTTTITNKYGESQTFTDETATMSQLYRDTWLLRPNGKHEFTSETNNQTKTVDVYLRQSNDTVYVCNLYGLGGPESYMLLNENGSMSYPSQPFCDITPEMSASGDGMWWNVSSDLTPGNAGNVTTSMITWGLIKPWDHAITWKGWYNNKLYFTDGEFVIPGGPTPPEYIRGDVNNDEVVNISDVTALIDHLLMNDFSEADNFNPLAANCNQDEDINISDVTALIDFLLSSVWN